MIIALLAAAAVCLSPTEVGVIRDMVQIDLSIGNHEKQRYEQMRARHEALVRAHVTDDDWWLADNSRQNSIKYLTEARAIEHAVALARKCP